MKRKRNKGSTCESGSEETEYGLVLPSSITAGDQALFSDLRKKNKEMTVRPGETGMRNAVNLSRLLTRWISRHLCCVMTSFGRTVALT